MEYLSANANAKVHSLTSRWLNWSPVQNSCPYSSDSHRPGGRHFKAASPLTAAVSSRVAIEGSLGPAADSHSTIHSMMAAMGNRCWA